MALLPWARLPCVSLLPDQRAFLIVLVVYYRVFPGVASR
jgi:hypothetical protein